MSEENVLCTHFLTVRFDQLEGDCVNWSIETDDSVRITREFSLFDMAECGAPLSAMAVRALLKICADGLIYHSLETANGIQVEVERRSTAHSGLSCQDAVPEGATIN